MNFSRDDSPRILLGIRQLAGQPAGALGQFWGQISPCEALDHTVRELSSISVRVSWFGTILTKILCQNFKKCILLNKLHFLIFCTKSWSESPKTIKIKEISSRAFERCGREPHTTRFDPSYGPVGWPAGWPAGAEPFSWFGRTSGFKSIQIGSTQSKSGQVNRNQPGWRTTGTGTAATTPKPAHEVVNQTCATGNGVQLEPEHTQNQCNWNRSNA